MDEYVKQAEEFLSKTGTTLEVKFVGFKKHFLEEKHERFTYEFTLTRGTRSYTGIFGGSLNDVALYLREVLREKSFRYPAVSMFESELVDRFKVALRQGARILHNGYRPSMIREFPLPNTYDILCCLTKYNPCTLEDFCSEHGYNVDSKKAEKVYKAVTEEYNGLCMLFSDSELSQLAEIN